MIKTSAISEQELIQECKKGSLKHQEILYKDFFGYAMGVGLRYLTNRDDAMEVVNDAFIKVFRSFDTFREDQSFKPWLRRIVVNAAIDRRRKDLKHLYHEDVDAAEGISFHAEAIGNLNAKDILKMFRFLSPVQRTVFNMYEIDGYSHDEIAELLGMPSSTSRVNLSRAKEKLRKLCTIEDVYERTGR